VKVGRSGGTAPGRCMSDDAHIGVMVDTLH
jgi:hypothetical protein